MRGVVLALALAGCAAPVVHPVRALPPVPPSSLQSCPPGVRAPKPPPTPRSVAALLDWAIAEDRALAGTEAARVECARRLERLNEWVVDREVGR